MNYENYFNDIFESISDYRKIVLLFFIIENDKNLLKENGYGKRDINRSKLEFKNILIEQHEKNLEYVTNEKESIIERILNK